MSGSLLGVLESVFSPLEDEGFLCFGGILGLWFVVVLV